MNVNIVESDTVVINLKYHAKNGEITKFKCRMSTSFEKIFNAFAEREDIDVNSFRFLVDGKRVNPLSTSETPEMEELIDDNEIEIDVFIDAIGGGFHINKW